ncbi:MAG: hypothetical protein O2960_00620 [Verrucomicrobia bacterium]|nr:hypothetical protein [Verrucomicrobiota bacterium]
MHSSRYDSSQHPQCGTELETVRHLRRHKASNEDTAEPQLLLHQIEESSAEAGDPGRATKDERCNWYDSSFRGPVGRHSVEPCYEEVVGDQLSGHSQGDSGFRHIFRQVLECGNGACAVAAFDMEQSGLELSRTLDPSIPPKRKR